MDWVEPKYPRNRVNHAGKVLVNPSAPEEEFFDALEVINNWRGCHNYPLNTFKVTLRKKSAEVYKRRLVAQRIKRLSSITLKLERFPTMKLAQMQDIGGCRAIMGNMKQVLELVEKYENSDLKHELVHKDDYILKPKSSGYRGVHLIYSYYSDKDAPSIYNGLKIEIQIRSNLQHAWATAVETIGTFLSQSLKSSQGEEAWLRFFALMGSEIAFKEGAENCVPQTPPDHSDLIREIRALNQELNVEHTMGMFSAALNVMGTHSKIKGHYFLLTLNPEEKSMMISSFEKDQLEFASEEYLRVEKDIAKGSGVNAVLVSVDSINSLRRAFPNYFLDSSKFLEILRGSLA